MYFVIVVSCINSSLHGRCKSPLMQVCGNQFSTGWVGQKANFTKCLYFAYGQYKLERVCHVSSSRYDCVINRVLLNNTNK